MVDDVLVRGLGIVFVGYNPGVKSGALGHHFAGPGNLFWALLADAGLTGYRLRPEEDRTLLAWGLGILNLVDRVTPGSADLLAEEMVAGSRRVLAKLHQSRPEIACFLGKDVYRFYRGWPRSAEVSWGLQAESQIPFMKEFVAPNPSRRSTLPYALRLRYFRELQHLKESGTVAGHGQVTVSNRSKP